MLEPPTRAMPSASLRLLPPLYCPAGRSAISSGSAVRCSTVAISARRRSRGTPCKSRTGLQPLMGRAHKQIDAYTTNGRSAHKRSSAVL